MCCTVGTSDDPFRQLQKLAKSAAMHDSGEIFDRPKCHENTRVAVLKRFTDWMLGAFVRAACIMWLYGGAGAGKSTIAQTLAEWCAERSMLLGGFFFSRGDPQRSHLTFFVPTIVYQAVMAYPLLKSHVIAALERDPLVFSKSLRVQFDTLLINPLNALHRNNSQPPIQAPHVIIIDGLDECSDAEQQCHVLDILSGAIQKCKIPLKVLVVSRPEVVIKGAFNCNPLQALSERVALDDSEETDADIRRLFVDAFEKLKRTHQIKGHIPKSWPDSSLIDELVKRASGQFIYAATVIKYISSPYHHPVDRLEIILGLRVNPSERDLPFAQLDALFLEILSSIPPENRTLVMTIIGVLVVEAVQAPMFQDLQCLAEFFALQVADVELLLGNLASIIKVDHYSLVEVSHASLGDFLQDKRRSRDFYIDCGVLSADILHICLRNFSLGGRNCENSFNRVNCPDSSLLDRLGTFLRLGKTIIFVTLFGFKARPSTEILTN